MRDHSFKERIDKIQRGGSVFQISVKVDPSENPEKQDTHRRR